MDNGNEQLPDFVPESLTSEKIVASQRRAKRRAKIRNFWTLFCIKMVAGIVVVYFLLTYLVTNFLNIRDPDLQKLAMLIGVGFLVLIARK